MAGLRERNKERNQKRIIQSAKKLFKEKGVQKASIAEIARDAEVATGTVYNYFSSKGSLLLAIFAEDMAGMQPECQIDVNPEESNLTDDLMALMQKLSFFFTGYSKEFWREMLQVLPAELEGNDLLRKGFYDLDGEAIVWTERIIEQYKDAFRIPVDTQQAATAIYSILVTQSLMFIYEDSMTYELFMTSIKQQIEFIFSGKLN